MKCTVDVMHLIHPKMIPLHLNHGKIVFHETGPWYQKRLGATALEACYREVTNVVKQVTWIQIQTLPSPGIIYLTTLCISLLICETGVITILQMDFMKTECDNACKVFSILPGTLQALNKY